MELKISQLRDILNYIDDESSGYRRGLQERICHKGDMCFVKDENLRSFSLEELDEGSGVFMEIIRVTLNDCHEPVIKID